MTKDLSPVAVMSVLLQNVCTRTLQVSSKTVTQGPCKARKAVRLVDVSR